MCTAIKAGDEGACPEVNQALTASSKPALSQVGQYNWTKIAKDFVGQNDNIDVDQELTKDEVAKPF